jgi:hypothetical protein
VLPGGPTKRLADAEKPPLNPIGLDALTLHVLTSLTKGLSVLLDHAVDPFSALAHVRLFDRGHRTPPVQQG